MLMWLTWWCGQFYDRDGDVVAMMVRQPAMTIVRNTEVSQLNFLGVSYYIGYLKFKITYIYKYTTSNIWQKFYPNYWISNTNTVNDLC